MVKLLKLFKPKKLHKYFGLHGLTQGCWWVLVIFAPNIVTSFLPENINPWLFSIGSAVVIGLLTHKHGKNCNWI